MTTVAPLRTEERSRWEQLWQEYQRFYGVVLPPEVTDATWQRLHDGRVHGLGARDSSGYLLGIVHFRLLSSGSLRRSKNTRHRLLPTAHRSGRWSGTGRGSESSLLVDARNQ